MSVDVWTMTSAPIETNWNLGNVVGVVAGIIAILGAVAAAIAWLVALGGRKQRIDDLLDATNNFPEWKTGVDGLLEVTKDFPDWKSRVDRKLSEIQTKVDRILEKLREQPQSRIIRPFSPLSLTELGRDVAEAIDASTWAKQTALELRAKTSDMSPYEVQEYCIRYCLFEYTPTKSHLEKLEQCAFEKGVQMDGVLQVLGIVLRDEMLQS